MRSRCSFRLVTTLTSFVLAASALGCSTVEGAFDVFFPGGSAPAQDEAKQGGADQASALQQQQPDNAPYAASTSCKTCHTTIYEQWSQSMHANALKGPLVVAQTNADMQVSLKGESAEAKGVCVNCHGPVAGLGAQPGAALPLAGGDERANEGISCVACHSASAGANSPGGGGLKDDFGAKIKPGRLYYGPIDQPGGNGFHQSAASTAFKSPDNLCGSCHDVNLDRNKDGQILKGTDLVLQTTFDEYNDYRAAGGAQSCADCHMPVVQGVTSVAPGAPGSTPPRELHDHSFVGVDQRFDLPGDPQAAKRTALLRSAATLAFVQTPSAIGGTLSFSVAIDNQSGHNLPTGFAFARQLWLEVVATDGAGRTAFSSGVLANPSDDLCDQDTMADALADGVQGCTQIDAQLVNLQLKLVDRVRGDFSNVDKLTPNASGRLEPNLLADDGARETPFQFVAGGPVARKRPIDGTPLGTILPRQTRVFDYANVPLATTITPGTGASLRVRLLFRPLPPYFVRALDSRGNVAQKVAPIIDQLKVVEIATLTAPL